MSNIYIQEPPTDGKVLLVTGVGEIDIELWSREAPKACRNFVQLCLEGYYNGTIFHRVVKDFIIQGGDPTGTGEGGESIYGAPFKDEFHSRLRFVRRGLVAMANAGPNDNGSQFFFTMASTPELQNKHTIFGKVGGDTIYNVIRLQDVDIDSNDRPTYPLKIKHTKVLSNPFDDIVPRLKTIESEESDSKSKNKSKGTKNYSLLSFGEEAEEDEEEVSMAVKDMKGKSKSSHDLTDDPKLSSQPAVSSEDKKRKMDSDDDSEEE
ncbi:peptidyl-prolyl cis-trans isomerase CWC27 homolog, partial [Mizuhopecten yessoensis]